LIKAKRLQGVDDARFKELSRRGKVAFLMYLRMVLEPQNFKIERPMRITITIGSFTNYNRWNFFEFCQADLVRILIGLEVDGDKYTLENGSVMSGEEILLRGLYELVSGDDQYLIAERMFGRDQSQIYLVID
jgi:hypothetical protein